MSLSLEQLTLAYPKHLWVEFSDEDQQKALPQDEDYSHDAACFRALMNQLCINVLVPAIAPELDASTSSNNSRSQQSATTIRLSHAPEAYKSIWEVVNGTKIIIGQTQIVIIPSIAIDTEELSVPQEWVDIPEWAADYYLAVQVNLDDGWLRVWGLTTHQKLKNEGRYDGCDRTYSLDSEDLFDNLNVLFVGRSFGIESKAEIQPLPKLSPTQVENLLVQLSKTKSYSPRLQVAFAQWAALLVKESEIQHLYKRRLGKPTKPALSKWFENISIPEWLSLPDLVGINSLSFAGARGKDRDSQDATPIAIKGKIVDLGILLVSHPVALIVKAEKEAENKCNILLRVHPGGNQTYLPPDVQLIVLEETGDVFLEAKSRSADNWIQLEFSGEVGEQFKVKVALGDASVTEDFVI